MKKFLIKSLPLKLVIQDIAKEFNTDYSEECEEYRLELPEEIGEGRIQGINFTSGLGILLYDCMFKEDVELHFTVNDVHPAKFLYCTEGRLVHCFEDEPSKNALDKFQGAIVASAGHGGHILYFQKNKRIKISSLEINREIFQKKIECSLDTIDPSLESLLQDVEANNSFNYRGFYSLYMADALYEIEEFEYKGLVRKLFMEGKSYQMLTHQIIQYLDDLKEEENRTVLRRTELNKIVEAIRLIQKELHELDTVKEIARRVGTNENKLQQGFKSLTGTTVKQYIQNARMDAAKELLIASDLSISEIVYNIGLSNRGYFSRIFKEKYNVSPSVFRQRQKLHQGDHDEDYEDD